MGDFSVSGQGFPRLEIDNSSPAVSGNSDSSAMLITSRSHLPGMEFRARHIDTVERFTCSPFATAPVPPSASINSDADPICFASMRDRLSQNVRDWKPQSSRSVISPTVNSRDSRFGREKHRLVMGRKYWQYDGAETLSRIDIVLRERHQIDIKERGQIKRAAGLLGIGASTIPMWQKRGGVPIGKVGELAEALEVRVEFLLAIDDDMGDPPVYPAEKSNVVRMEQRILDAIDERFAEFERRLSKLEKTG